MTKITDNEQREAAFIPHLNRDLSWVDFNERVLDEGLRKDLPLLERFRFLSIVTSNFDEFFMVRVAAIKRALHLNAAEHAADPSGLSPVQQLREISKKVHQIISRQYECLRNEIFPELAHCGLILLRPDSYSVPHMDFLESYFMGQIYPILTPLRIEDDKPLPFIESRVINAAFLLDSEDQTGEKSTEHLVVVMLPRALSRIIWNPFFWGRYIRFLLRYV